MAEGSSGKRKLDKENGKNEQGKTKKIAGHWSMGLHASMNDPELVVDSDDKLVIIKDKYPKVEIEAKMKFAFSFLWKLIRCHSVILIDGIYQLYFILKT